MLSAIFLVYIKGKQTLGVKTALVCVVFHIIHISFIVTRKVGVVDRRLTMVLQQ